MLKLETNEVPTGLESYYEDAGNGIFKLKVEGAVPVAQLEEVKTKLGEFRNNNVELKKKVDALSQFETMFQSGEFSAEKISSKVETLALQRASEMKTALEQQIAELTNGLQSEKSRVQQIVLSDAVNKAALKHGVSETALEDVLARAKGAFKVEEGNLVPVDPNLDVKGNKPTLETWMASLATAAPHLFQGSRGTGAQKPGKPIQQLSTDDKIRNGVAKLFK